MKLRRKTTVKLSTLMISVGLLTSSVQAAASESAPLATDAGVACSAYDPDGERPVIRDTTSEPAKASLVQSITEGLDHGSYHIEGDLGQLNLSAAKSATIISRHNDDFNFVTVPYRNGGDYNYLSNITFAFDSSSTTVPKTVTETLYTRSAEGKFRVEVYQNGNKITDKVTEFEYVDGSTLEATAHTPTADPESPELQDRRRAQGCIAAVLGVNMTIAGLVLSTCVSACTAEPIGATVCAACVAGVFALGAGDVTALPECFKL